MDGCGLVMCSLSRDYERGWGGESLRDVWIRCVVSEVVDGGYGGDLTPAKLSKCMLTVLTALPVWAGRFVRGSAEFARPNRTNLLSSVSTNICHDGSGVDLGSHLI